MACPARSRCRIFDTAFRAARIGPGGGSCDGFTNGTFITQLQQGQAGRLANTLAGSGEFRYLCAMVGNTLPGCASRGYDAPGAVSDQLLPGEPVRGRHADRLLTDEAQSDYDSLQVQFRKRYGAGHVAHGELHLGHARTDRYVVGADGVQDYHTLHDKSLDWGPTAYDLRHNFQTYGTYELPFGTRPEDRDRQRRRSKQAIRRLGGVRHRCASRPGRPFLLTSGRQTLNQDDAGVVLNGITVEDLQKHDQRAARSERQRLLRRRDAHRQRRPRESRSSSRRRPRRASRASTSISTAPGSGRRI